MNDLSREEISRFFAKRDGTSVEVPEVHVFKFGAILLAEDTPGEDEANRYTACEKLNSGPWQPKEDILEELVRALRNHTNVFHLESPDDLAPSFQGTRTGMLVDGPAITMEIHLPKSKQKFPDEDSPESFSAMINGSFFGAYAPAKSAPAPSFIGHEFRELVRTLVETSTTYKAPLFGPCPVFSSVFVGFVGSSTPTASVVIRSREFQGDLYVLVEGGADKQRTMKWVFALANNCWQGFYALSLFRCELIDLDVEIQNRFEEASQTVVKLAKTPGWKIWETSKLGTQAALEIGEVHRLVIKYDEACWGYDKQKSEYLKILFGVPHFSKLRRTTADYCVRDVRPPARISQALEFLEKQVEVARNIRSLVLASLMGAMVGSLVTGILTLAKGK
jgi:hypothetical protein